MSGTTLPGPGIDFEVCFGVGRRTPGATWDNGIWDFNSWLETDTPMGDWVDVTCDVTDGVAMAAGSSADGVVTRWEAQTCAFTMRGATWDPRSGPYVGLLGPSLPVRMRWKPAGTTDDEWLTTFLGQVNSDGFTYDPKTERAQISATDGTAILAAFDGVEQNAQGAGETAAARVTRIANMAQWPAERRDITPGGVTVKSTTLAEAAWTMLLAVADTDLALLWVNRNGDLAFRPEGKVMPSHRVGAIIGCGVTDAPPGAVVIEPVNMVGQQPTVTRNIVAISREAANDQDNAVTFTARDEESVARFLAHRYERTDLIHQADQWSQTVAEAVLMGSAWPHTSPESVDLNSRTDPAATALLLSLEPSLSIEVTDGVTVWECEPAGWTVTVGRNAVFGTINLLDVSAWYGGTWDDGNAGAGWDLTPWGGF